MAIAAMMFGPVVMPKAQNAITLVREVANWNPRYGHITYADLHRLGSPAVELDLQYFRLNPSALDQKAVMQYFIAVNNCNNREVGRALSNELDYPALAGMYKTNAAQIFASLPQTIDNFAFERFIGGSTDGGWALWTRSLTLGEYDRQRKAFPLKRPDSADVKIPALLALDGVRRLERTCPAAGNFVRSASASLPGEHSLALPPATYRELPMDEASARQYIDRAGPQRKENWNAVDHMYDIRFSVYVSLLADACQWPLSDAQNANLKRFLDRVSNGGYYEKMQYNAARTTVQTKIIGARGRIEYCAGPESRKSFDKYAAMVAPRGPLTASAAK